MNVTALIPLHYGSEYLAQVVTALRPHVQRVVVLYTPKPSFGHATTVPVPEAEQEENLHALVRDLDVEWFRGEFGGEGHHRNVGYSLCKGADLILQCDSDEVWHPASLKTCLEMAADQPYERYYIDGFVHHWRSFELACADTWYPERIIKPGGTGKTTLKGVVHHFGYAQSERVIEYKWLIHGHKNELRPNWFTDIFKDESRRDDLHPTTFNWWYAKPFDASLMPEVLKRHPYYGLPLIR